MLRAVSSSAAKRAVSYSKSSPLCSAPRTMLYHATAKREEEVQKVEVAPKGGLFGTGLSEWFALPIGIVGAIPLIKYEWLVINEELQLATCFITFCVAVYTQGGDAMYNSMKEQADAIMTEHQELEEELLDSLETKMTMLKMAKDVVNDYRAVNVMREEAYANLNAAGAVKPMHDFKTQVERVLNMIVQEEASVAEKRKVALMEEATASVTEEFSSSKAMKKAALDQAIATIKGSGTAGADPVTASFVKFFKDKAAEAAKTDDGSEERDQRLALVSKLNAVAKSEGFFFQFETDGTPKMVV